LQEESPIDSRLPGLAIVPNNDIPTVNGGNGKIVEITPVFEWSLCETSGIHTTQKNRHSKPCRAINNWAMMKMKLLQII